MAYQSTGAKNKRRGELSKLDLAETYYRGGVSLGYELALASVKRFGLIASERKLAELEEWAESDPSIERDPPGLALETAA